MKRNNGEGEDRVVVGDEARKKIEQAGLNPRTEAGNEKVQLGKAIMEAFCTGQLTQQELQVYFTRYDLGPDTRSKVIEQCMAFLLRQGDMKSAEKLIEYESDPEYQDAHRGLLAIILARAGEMEEAERVVRTIVNEEVRERRIKMIKSETKN